MIIVAVKDDPGFSEMGFRFFDEADWPKPGYTLLKRIITDMSAKEFAAWDARNNP